MQTILNFLDQLKDNNTREWFQEHKEEYEKSRAEFIDFLQQFLPQMAAVDPRVAGLEPKNCIFRIYRDVRFSKEKHPYKTHFGAWIANVNKNLITPGYYVHLEPNASFLAGGLWMPPAEELKKIRQEIDYNGSQLHKIVEETAFQTYFKAFSEEEKLKTAPKGYMADHADIEWLKLKSFTVSCSVTDEQVCSKSFVNQCIDTFRALKPLNDFLRTAIA